MPSSARRHERPDCKLPGLTGKIPAKNGSTPKIDLACRKNARKINNVSYLFPLIVSAGTGYFSAPITGKNHDKREITGKYSERLDDASHLVAQGTLPSWR